MKKYLFGLIAVAFAVAFSAFTTKTTELYYFHGTSNAQMSDEDLWDDQEPTVECGGSQAVVCVVTSDAVDEEAFDALIIGKRPTNESELLEIDGVDISDRKPAE